MTIKKKRDSVVQDHINTDLLKKYLKISQLKILCENFGSFKKVGQFFLSWFCFFY